MNFFISIFTLIFITSVHAESDFCRNINSPTFAADILENDNNRLSFRNDGGLFNQGVCWWHSRFTRNATLLAKFDSEKFSSRSEIEQVIHDIRLGKKVVSINGFQNLKEFSAAYEQEIQDEIEKWQKTDAFIYQQWIVGLAGRRKLPAKKMKARMDYLFDYIQAGNIAYLKLQLKGVASHSWLVTSMIKNENGYELTIVDSNRKQLQSYQYTFGDTSFNHPSYGRFVPYLSKKNEMERISKLRQNFCLPKHP